MTDPNTVDDMDAKEPTEAPQKRFTRGTPRRRTGVSWRENRFSDNSERPEWSEEISITLSDEGPDMCIGLEIATDSNFGGERQEVMLDDEHFAEFVRAVNEVAARRGIKV